MRAVMLRETGGPEVLRIQEVPDPEPAAGEARVRIEAIGLNFIDVYYRNGSYPLDLPTVPGVEAAGTVESLGDGVEDLAVGDRVAFMMLPGAYAELAVVDASRLVPVPAGIDSRTAAACLLQGLTAHYLSRSTFPAGADDTALVLAAAGGVGHLLVQFLGERGTRVLATASTEEKAGLARGDGADEVIMYRETDLAAAVRDLTDGRGVDVVYDGVGADTFDAGLESLRPRGMMVLYGASSGPVPPLDPQRLRAGGSLFLTRPSLGHYAADRQELLERSSELFSGLSNGRLHVRTDREMPLEEVAEAHRYLEAGRTKGKVVLVP